MVVVRGRTGDGTVKVRRVTPAFTDARGEITDIGDGTPFDHATVITTRSGGVRGNHYHVASTQWVYVVSGRMRVTTQVPGAAIERTVVAAGDLFENDAGERHAMKALEDTVFLVLSRGPRGGTGFESDTFRLGPTELLEPPS